jgi:hypothetical protein
MFRRSDERPEHDGTHTCLPLALSIPEQMAHVESNTWNNATNGRIDATSVTTSESMMAVREQLNFHIYSNIPMSLLNK